MGLVRGCTDESLIPGLFNDAFSIELKRYGVTRSWPILTHYQHISGGTVKNHSNLGPLEYNKRVNHSAEMFSHVSGNREKGRYGTNSRGRI